MDIPVYKPLIGKEEIDNVMSALKSTAISGTYGEFIGQFEKGFSEYSQCSFGIGVNSGTAALHLALASFGIGAGDEVLVSSFTNMATFFSVLYQGAKPIPVDIEADTWNINPELVESKITKKTKAIVVVHIYGHPVDIDPIVEIARKHDLWLLEDCAEAHGAEYKGRKVGSLGDAGCFSFHASKIITTGEGGMVTTNDPWIAERCRMLQNLAFGEKSKFMHRDIGLMYLMPNLQAALGCAQLKRIDGLIEKKREIARFYNEALGVESGLQLPVEKKYAKNVYWMYHMVVHEKEFGMTRDEIRKRLWEYRIETRDGFIPYNQQEVILERGLAEAADCPVANFAGKNGFYIPSTPLLTQEEMEYVAKKITEIHAVVRQTN